MKKVLFGLLIISGLIFSEEYKQNKLHEGDTIGFSIENTKLDLNNDGVKEIIKFNSKIPNAIIIDGNMFQPVGEYTIDSFLLTKKSNQIYIVFQYQKDYIYTTKIYIYDGKNIVTIPKDYEKEKLKAELESKIKAIKSNIKKSTNYDYYYENNIAIEECEMSDYTICYDMSGNIISVSHKELSQTGESGETETQYYKNGNLKYINIISWGIYDESTEFLFEMEDGVIKSYVVDSDNELEELMYDIPEYIKECHDKFYSFLINKQFVNPKDSQSLYGFIDNYSKAIMGEKEIFETDIFIENKEVVTHIKDFIDKVLDKSMDIHKFKILSSNIKKVNSDYKVELLVKYDLVYADFIYEVYTVIDFTYFTRTIENGIITDFDERRIQLVDLDYKTIDEIFKNNENTADKIKELELEGIKKITEYCPLEISVEEYGNYLFQYANLLIEKNRHEEAFIILKRLLDLPVENAQIYLSLGDCYSNEYEKSKSKLDFEEMYKNYYKYSQGLNKQEKLPKRVQEVLKKNTSIQLIEADKNQRKLITDYLEKLDSEYTEDIISLYGKEEEFYCAYNDLNKDGSPELLTFISSPHRSGSRSQGEFYIYTVKNKKIDKEIFATCGMINYTENDTFFAFDDNSLWRTIKIRSNYGLKIVKWNGNKYDYDTKENIDSTKLYSANSKGLIEILKKNFSINKKGSGLIKEPIAWGDSYESFNIDYEYYTMNNLIRFDDCNASIPIDLRNKKSLKNNFSVTLEEARDICNRLSLKYNLPLAYNSNDKLIDEFGNETTDVSQVKGFRLMNMEEWINSVINNKDFKEWDDKILELINFSDNYAYMVGSPSGKKDKVSLNTVERVDLFSEGNFRLVLTKN